MRFAALPAACPAMACPRDLLPLGLRRIFLAQQQRSPWPRHPPLAPSGLKAAGSAGRGAEQIARPSPRWSRSKQHVKNITMAQIATVHAATKMLLHRHPPDASPPHHHGALRPGPNPRKSRRPEPGARLGGNNVRDRCGWKRTSKGEHPCLILGELDAPSLPGTETYANLVDGRRTGHALVGRLKTRPAPQGRRAASARGSSTPPGLCLSAATSKGPKTDSHDATSRQ